MIWALVFVSAVYLVLYLYRDAQIQRERQDWASERKELLNRIQAPERLPITAGEPQDPLEVDSDQLALVGSIDYQEDGDG